MQQGRGLVRYTNTEDEADVPSRWQILTSIVTGVLCETNALASTNTPRIQIHRGECKSVRQAGDGAANRRLGGLREARRRAGECQGEVWGEDGGWRKRIRQSEILDKTTQISASGVPLVWGVSGVTAESAPMAVPLWRAAPGLERSKAAPGKPVLLLCAFLCLQNRPSGGTRSDPISPAPNSKTTPTPAFRYTGLRNISQSDRCVLLSTRRDCPIMQGIIYIGV